MTDKETKRMIRANRWAEEYRKWQSSKLKQREYCQKEGLSFWKFKAGVDAAAQSGMISRGRRRWVYENSQEPEKLSGFAAVQINADQTIAPYCEIRFNGKSGIRIETPDSLIFLRELLGVTP